MSVAYLLYISCSNGFVRSYISCMHVSYCTLYISHRCFDDQLSFSFHAFPFKVCDIKYGDVCQF